MLFSNSRVPDHRTLPVDGLSADEIATVKQHMEKSGKQKLKEKLKKKQKINRVLLQEAIDKDRNE